MSPSYGGGGVMSLSGAFDPSVREDADTSPLRGEEKSYAITFLRGGVSTIGAKSSATNDAARRSSSTGR